MTPRDDERFAIALRILRAHPFGFFATCSGGRADVRLVQQLRVEDDATIWFATHPRSRKAAEIVENPTATYAVEERAAVAYATAIGHAAIVVDVEKGRELWDEGLRTIWPDGPDGDDFVLVRITTNRLEVMDFSFDEEFEAFEPWVLEREGSRWRSRPHELRAEPVRGDAGAQ